MQETCTNKYFVCQLAQALQVIGSPLETKKKKKTYHFYSRLHTTATENIFTEIMHLSADPSVTRDSLHLPANREVRLILK